MRALITALALACLLLAAPAALAGNLADWPAQIKKCQRAGHGTLGSFFVYYFHQETGAQYKIEEQSPGIYRIVDGMRPDRQIASGKSVKQTIKFLKSKCK